jgi:hypothetical protein
VAELKDAIAALDKILSYLLLQAMWVVTTSIKCDSYNPSHRVNQITQILIIAPLDSLSRRTRGKGYSQHGLTKSTERIILYSSIVSMEIHIYADL